MHRHVELRDQSLALRARGKPPRLGFRQSAFTIHDLADRPLARGYSDSSAFSHHALVPSTLSGEGVPTLLQTWVRCCVTHLAPVVSPPRQRLLRHMGAILCPIRLSVRALACRWGLPYLLPTRLDIPHEASRVPPGRLPWHETGGVLLSLPLPLSAAPQSLHRGSDRLTSVTPAPPATLHSLRPYSHRSYMISGSTG
jgi:hypothetical protein